MKEHAEMNDEEREAYKEELLEYAMQQRAKRLGKLNEELKQPDEETEVKPYERIR